MSQKYPSPAAPVNPVVLTACQDVPPATSVNDKLPEPSVFITWSTVPVAVGNTNVYEDATVPAALSPTY